MRRRTGAQMQERNSKLLHTSSCPVLRLIKPALHLKLILARYGINETWTTYDHLLLPLSLGNANYTICPTFHWERCLETEEKEGLES